MCSSWIEGFDCTHEATSHWSSNLFSGARRLAFSLNSNYNNFLSLGSKTEEIEEVVANASAELKDLKPNTNYTVFIRAYAITPGDRSEKFTILTEEDGECSDYIAAYIWMCTYIVVDGNFQ